MVSHLLPGTFCYVRLLPRYRGARYDWYCPFWKGYVYVSYLNTVSLCVDFLIVKREVCHMDAVQMLENSHAKVLETVDDLSEPLWDVPGVCGEWSVKDIIAHLASYERVVID